MTRDVAAQAVHERLERLVTTMPEPDLDAGWAALVAQLEPPVAPVVPLRRRPRPRRALLLGVAAAILIMGSAFAMVRHGGADGQPAAVHPSVTAPGHAAVGPHTHGSIVGSSPTHGAPPPASSGIHHHGGTGSTGDSAPSGDRSTGIPSGSGGHDGTHHTHHDAADDTDHGTGNDGTHDDNGQGNDTQGQNDQGTGSGGDQGSGGGQGSGNRGGAPGGSGGAKPSGGSGSGGGRGSEGQGQGGGHSGG